MSGLSSLCPDYLGVAGLAIIVLFLRMSHTGLFDVIGITLPELATLDKKEKNLSWHIAKLA